MREIKGRLDALGASTTLSKGSESLTTYSYIQLGGETIKKARAYTGIAGELSAALGDEVELYMQSGYVVGLRLSNGRAFSSAGHGTGKSALVLVCLLVLFIPVSITIIGFPLMLKLIWDHWKLLQAGLAAQSLPDAIAI